MKGKQVWIAITTVCLLLLALIPIMPVSEAQVSEKEIYRLTGEESSISGAIKFLGKAPKLDPVDMGSDSFCAKADRNPKTEMLIITNGKLANVFIYVKSGDAIDKYAFEEPKEYVVLERCKCEFTPHVLGVRTNQTLRFVNTDQTGHNTRPNPKHNRYFIKSQTSGGQPFDAKFKEAEMFMPIYCNQHPWEKAIVSVMTHPFFAVSDHAGQFKIQGLPPGAYRIAAWHEMFGEQIIDVTIGAREHKEANFTFKSSR